jgi:hypothetical protein
VEHILDNPVWNALISGNKNLSKGNDQVKYFPANVAPFVGLSQYGPDELQLLSKAIHGKRTLAVISLKEVEIPGPWNVIEHMKVLQMVYNHQNPPGIAPAKLSHLKKHNVPQMIALTKMTRPGPFFERTIEFGNYEGIFKDDQLIAMAGQRLHANQYEEISAVCVHHDYVGKGYASQLIINQIHRIKAELSVPFLHVKEDNTKAIRLYKNLGFDTREQMDIYIIRNFFQD